jgi:hypothetical protein
MFILRWRTSGMVPSKSMGIIQTQYLASRSYQRNISSMDGP